MAFVVVLLAVAAGALRSRRVAQVQKVPVEPDHAILLFAVHSRAAFAEPEVAIRQAETAVVRPHALDHIERVVPATGAVCTSSTISGSRQTENAPASILLSW